MRTDPSIVYMVPYHKQKVFQVSYCEVQFDNFFNKGMSLMSMMEVKWKLYVKISGFEYSFFDYVIKG